MEGGKGKGGRECVFFPRPTCGYSLVLYLLCLFSFCPFRRGEGVAASSTSMCMLTQRHIYSQHALRIKAFH